MEAIGWGTPFSFIEKVVEEEINASDDESPSRLEVELRVAQRYGFASWKQLKTYLTIQDSQENDFLSLACLTYFQIDSEGRRVTARKMLEDDLSLVDKDIYHAAAIGAVEQVEKFLKEDPELINKRGGYFDWEPLLYASYSRLNLPHRSTYKVAELLLARGADPNAHYMWGGQYRFTALTGAFGEGEMGPTNQPEHEEGFKLARLLLDAGAYPNDGQALYNRMFEPGSDCLRLLLDYGLNSKHKVNWLKEEDGEYSEYELGLLTYQLQWAVRNHHIERAMLLIDHGADVTYTWGDGESFYRAAILAGETQLAQLLLDRGAPKTEISDIELFLSRCMEGNTAGAHAMLDTAPDLVAVAETDFADSVGRAAGEGRLDALKTFQTLGFNLGFAQGQAPMHQAVLGGHVRIVEWLVDQGCDRNVRDEQHGSTPLQWALAIGRKDCFEFLSSFELELFDAILCNQSERIRKIIEADPQLLEVTLKSHRALENSFDDDWMTPLAYAATRQKIGAVRTLLELGADANVTNSENLSLREICKKNASAEVNSLLNARSKV